MSDNEVYENINLTVILAVFGNTSETEKLLMKTIESLSAVKDDSRLIVSIDGMCLSKLSVIQNLASKFEHIKIIKSKEELHLPAKLINLAFKHVNTPYVSILYPGCSFDGLVQEFAQNPKLDFSVYAIASQGYNKIPIRMDKTFIYGWGQCTKLFELSKLIISKKAWEQIGKFDESPLLQKDFDWEWMLRLSKQFIFNIIGTEEKNTIDLIGYPFKESFDFSDDIIHRYVLRNRTVPYKKDSGMEQDFYKDVKGYKITIIGGYWEYHHSQLTFLNYLDKLYGTGFATYKMLIDEISAPEDVDGSDLVIIIRSRSTKIPDIISKCKKDNIRTLYMLDDNMVSISQDFPTDFWKRFVRGNPEYDAFIGAVGTCDFVVTYNKLLYDDISVYNRNTILFPLNINLDFYKESEDMKDDKKDKILIGYAGSTRYDNVAFTALSNVARKYDNVRVLLFGGLSDEQKALFAGIDTIMLGHVPYQMYCKKMKELAPDILLAPLTEDRTSMSKCPNKYLEIGGIGSAGIYTDLYPYNKVVEDGVDGLLVPTNTVSAWEEKICLLINDKNLLERIKKQCHANVEKNYATEKVIKRFCEMIDGVMKGEIKND